MMAARSSVEIAKTIFRMAVNRPFLAAIVLAVPYVASAARTFASLTVTPASTNITAGATVTADVALGTKASTGSTASGPVVIYVGSVSPSASGITTGISPASYDIGTSATNDSILTVATPLNTPANTYTFYVVGATNSNNTLANVIPITNTFTLTVASAVGNDFSMSMSPAATEVIAGIATNVGATVGFLDYSANISGAATNGIAILPAGQGVTASLNSIYAPVTNNFGQTNLVLTMSAAADTVPGTYQVIVSGTNSSFTANSPAGVASATNIFTVVDENSFSVSASLMSPNVFRGIATNVNGTVTFIDYSPVLSGVLTNGVTVSPAGLGVTASLDSSLISLTANGGQGTLTLTVSAMANAVAGAYQIVVGATNNNFTANSPVPGIAMVTNLFMVVNPPSIQSVNLSSAALMMAGNNGTPYALYVVLASTNLPLPLAQWKTVLTNNFDSSGNFNTSISLTNTLSPTPAQQFFTLFQETNLVPSVATPTFSPIAQPYFSTTQVTITSTTPNSIIRYTTDGSTPSETNGTIYSGPVTVQQPANTNSSGYLTNCSGVTMLKAIAYKGGMPDSAVFTGNYEIIVPAPQTSAVPLIGLADIAYHVTDLAAMRAFYENYMGYAEPFLLPNSNTVAVVKINDQQYIELFQGALDPNQYQLASYGYQVTNAALYRAMLASNGVAVSPSVTTNFLGNLSFFSTDPDGHANEWGPVSYQQPDRTDAGAGHARHAGLWLYVRLWRIHHQFGKCV